MTVILTLNDPQFEILADILESAIVDGIWGNTTSAQGQNIHLALLRDKVRAIEIKRQERDANRRRLPEGGGVPHA